MTHKNTHFLMLLIQQPRPKRIATKGLIITCLLALVGCNALTSPPVAAPTKTAKCGTLFSELDHAIATYSHSEPNIPHIENHPGLRSNRFLNSYRHTTLPPQAQREWITALSNLGKRTYLLESRRIPETALHPTLATLEQPSLSAAIHDCSHHLLQDYLQEVQGAHIASSIQSIDDDYSDIARFFGIYPLTSYLAKPYIEEYKADMTRRFKEGNIGVSQATLYFPAPSPTTGEDDTSSTIKARFREAYAQSALGIPRFDQHDLEKWFQRHSPNLLIASTENNDKIGAPILLQDAHESTQLSIDTTLPQIYRYVSYTRIKEKALLQLNYAFWFPQRSPQHRFDIYAGLLDGIIWRVTLDEQGTPWIYDSIHQCGCYHKVYTHQGIQFNTQDPSLETPLHFLLSHASNHSRTLHIDANNHYIVGVSSTQSTTFPPNTQRIPYDYKDYDILSHLPHNDGSTSLFGEDGIVEASSRLERWFLWPLGVRSAGAMRQKGTHAVAFVGKRHFDDPWLFKDLGLTEASQ